MRATLVVFLGACSFTGHSTAIGDVVDGAVDVAPMIDGPPGEFCLGDAMVMVCLAQMPSMPLAINGMTMIDTDAAGQCSPAVVGANANDYCVLAGSSIMFVGNKPTLSAHGSRPVVLMSAGDIILPGPAAIDMAGHLASATTAPGGDLCAAGTPANGSGGGYGGSFGSLGGIGGADAGNNLGGVPSPAIVPQALHGGCGGEAGLTGGGIAGHGGGAVALLAAGMIQIDGLIDASGGGGGGSKTNNNKGGGGAGAGGMIVIDAPTVTGGATAKIVANGGSGGEGSGGMHGKDGNDPPPDPSMAAPGGAGGSTGGDGGFGATGTGLAGVEAGPGLAGTSGAGGGGGGGGVGVVKAFQNAVLPGMVSPPPS